MNEELQKLLEAIKRVSDEHPRANGHNVSQIIRFYDGSRPQVSALLGDLKELGYVRTNKQKLPGSKMPATTYYQLSVRGKALLNGEAEPAKQSLRSTSNPVPDYINPSLISQFSIKQDAFDYTKLVNILTELNDNYKHDNAYACSQLIKGLVNHIPPLLGFTNFNQVVSNYAWGVSQKPYIDDINKYINEANDVTHTVISGRQDQTTLSSLPKAMYINTLLAACLDEAGNHQPIKPERINNPQQPKPKAPVAEAGKISIEIKDQRLKWANWGGYGSGFMGNITVNNFTSSLNNFVVFAKLAYTLIEQTAWESTVYKFEGNGYNAKVKIAANDMLECQFWVSDAIREPQNSQGIMAVAAEDTLGKLEIGFADGTICKAEVLLTNNT